MTYYCSRCDVNWWPYQTIDGACCECGGGTRRTHDRACPDADARYKAEMDKRRAADAAQRRRDSFDAFYASRAAEVLIAEAEAILRDAA